MSLFILSKRQIAGLTHLSPYKVTPVADPQSDIITPFSSFRAEKYFRVFDWSHSRLTIHPSDNNSKKQIAGLTHLPSYKVTPVADPQSDKHPFLFFSLLHTYFRVVSLNTEDCNHDWSHSRLTIHPSENHSQKQIAGLTHLSPYKMTPVADPQSDNQPFLFFSRENFLMDITIGKKVSE
jgi:hypothetical protein